MAQVIVIPKNLDRKHKWVYSKDATTYYLIPVQNPPEKISKISELICVLPEH